MTIRARILLLIFLLASPCVAQDLTVEPKADQLLKEMGSYLKGMDNFSFHVDTIHEEERSHCLVELGSSVDAFIRRPNEFRINRSGDKGALEVFYDGQSVSLHSRDKGFYATSAAPPTIGAALDFMHDKLGVTLPVADLLFPNSYEVLSTDIESGFYVGLHPVMGVPCHHLSFIQKSGLQWQIWIEAGKMRVPRKLVLRHVDQPGVPHFSALFSDWDPNTPIADDLFHFEAPPEAHKIEFVNTKGAK